MYSAKFGSSLKKEILDENNAICKFCLALLHSTERVEVLSPCNCHHHTKWAHKSCLDRFRCTRIEDKDFYRCRFCDSNYEIKSVLPPASLSARRVFREKRHRLLFLRDFIIGNFLFQTFVVFISTILFYADQGTNLALFSHINAFQMLSLDFYYFFALLLVLTCLGLLIILSIFLRFDATSGRIGNDSIGYIDIYILETMDLLLKRTVAWIYSSRNFLYSCCNFTCDLLSSDVGSIIMMFLIAAIFLILIILSPLLGFLYLFCLMERHADILSKNLLADDFIVVDKDPLLPLYLNDNGINVINPLLYINSPNTPLKEDRRGIVGYNVLNSPPRDDQYELNINSNSNSNSDDLDDVDLAYSDERLDTYLSVLNPLI
jgi:hypothetical protein